jgi:hypothetical protein
MKKELKILQKQTVAVRVESLVELQAAKAILKACKQEYLERYQKIVFKKEEFIFESNQLLFLLFDVEQRAWWLSKFDYSRKEIGIDQLEETLKTESKLYKIRRVKTTR